MVFRRERYPDDWKAIRAGILLRANNRCEWCFAPNGEGIVRGSGGDAGTYMVQRGDVFDEETGARVGIARGSEFEGRGVKVVLTVAHLDHDEANNDPANLAALCQLHHLRHDRADNVARGKANRAAASGQGSLFDAHGGGHE